MVKKEAVITQSNPKKPAKPAGTRQQTTFLKDEPILDDYDFVEAEDTPKAMGVTSSQKSNAYSEASSRATT